MNNIILDFLNSYDQPKFIVKKIDFMQYLIKEYPIESGDEFEHLTIEGWRYLKKNNYVGDFMWIYDSYFKEIIVKKNDE